MPNRKTILLLMTAAFCLRLMFGLFRSQIWEIDQKQTYLIGLKCYTTGTWPYFGPDVNGAENSFRSQIPGAMEGLLIALPLYVLPIPEAPFILLNLLSVLGITLLTWYIVKRVPGVSFPWLFAWICIVPWSIHESTTIINPAFAFLPSILFFIGFMESMPIFTLNLITPRLANMAMGFSLFWIMQFHFSYIYLVPLALLSLAVQVLKSRRWTSVPFFLLGSLPMLALIAPTYLQFGMARGNVASGFAVPFNWSNVGEFWTILARFFSLVSFEVPRFIGVSVQSRTDFLVKEHPLLAVPGFLLWGLGLLQPFVLVAVWFKELRRMSQKLFWTGYALITILVMVGDQARWLQWLGVSAGVAVLSYLIGLYINWLKPKRLGPQWPELNLLLVAVLGMVFASFWFTVKMPLSHIYFVFFPLLMTYSCYCWMAFKGEKFWRTATKVVLVLGILFQLGYAVSVMPQDSIYPQRDKMVQAIQQKNYHLFAERRPESLY